MRTHAASRWPTQRYRVQPMRPAWTVWDYLVLWVVGVTVALSAAAAAFALFLLGLLARDLGVWAIKSLFFALGGKGLSS